MKMNAEKILENLKKLENLKNLKNLKLKQIVYPAAFGAVAILAITFFAKTIVFLSANINKALKIEDEKSVLIQLNMADYSIVAKKLNVVVSNNTETAVSQPPAPVLATTSTAMTATSTPETVLPVKSALKIAVLNSTKTEGLAAGLKKDLESAGFSVLKTANQSKTENTTLIKIKESVGSSALAKEISGLVKNKYPLITNETLNEKSEYDIEIVIGKK